MTCNHELGKSESHVLSYIGNGIYQCDCKGCEKKFRINEVV